ncbi:uncharacterized protein LOC124103713 [Marmota monax]|uniref:uncharacterized protein LOC124103713 n=1 Tax=Marmota monax TaxID=9995 RepID=UPI0026EB13F8|nr:uncharacterized protein LOC124103713 [Marmota monax]
MLTVVVQVELERGSGPKETHSPTILLEGPKSLQLLQLGNLETQEAEQELLARVQTTLASVGQGYSVSLLLRGRETEAPRFVPQLLQMLFEEALSLHRSDHVLSTLSLVQVKLLGVEEMGLGPGSQGHVTLKKGPAACGEPEELGSSPTLRLTRISPSGKTWDLLSPGVEDLSVLDVAPLGLTCFLLTVTMFCPGPKPPEGPGTHGVWRGALRILQLPGTPDCPLLRVLAGEAVGEKVEGSLPWIVSWLLEGNNYSGLLIHLDPQDGWGSSLRLLQAALLGASGRRMQMKEVKPTWWDAVEEARARRASLRTLRLSLFGDTLTDSGLSQLGRALRELQVIKAWSQCPRRGTTKGSTAEAVGFPEPQVKPEPPKYPKQGRQHYSHFSVAERTSSLGPGLHQKHPLRNFEEQSQQAPDVALQLLTAQVRRQRLREQHQIWIQEEIKHLEQEEVVHEQVKGLVAEEETCEKRPRWHRELKVLRLQVEALQAERDIAEEDLASFYDLHVQATRAQTSHILQVFRAWQRLQEEQAMTTEHRHRSLLACVLQDTIDLASRNQELQAQNQQLQQGAMKGGAIRLDLCLRVKPDD